MVIHAALPPALQEVDVLVVGGGAAGCVITSRLAEADPQLSILLIESGADNYNNPIITHPALYRANYGPNSTHYASWQGQEEEQIGGRAITIQTGSVLGGGTSVNGAIYARGQLVDFDSWGAKSWSGEDVLPFLRKLETFHGPDARHVHGHEGPTDVSSGTYRGKGLEQDFLFAAEKVGFGTVDDVHDLYAINAASTSRRYVSSRDGRRQDAAHTYLHPRLQDANYPNLHVLVGAQVSRVLLHAKKEATGVEYRFNPKLQTIEGESGSDVHQVQARKLVILSAGALGTPSILERSGIGNREVLGGAGVPPVHHLPGVGHDYQDHQSAVYTYNSRLPTEYTWESLFSGVRNVTELIATDDEMLSWNGIDAFAKIRPTSAEVDALGPAFRRIWDRDFAPVPSKPLAALVLVNGILGDPTPFPPRKPSFSICGYTAYPYSRGYIHISGPGIDDPVNFRTSYLSDPDDFDIKAHVWLYKKQRGLVSGMSLLDSEIPSQHPAFPEGSTSGVGSADIGYTPEDDKAIEEFLRTKVGTTWHMVGTAKMAPEGESGVVDESLAVHGIRRLKVADLSIAPQEVAGNTMNTALLIGERAADIFIRDLGL